MTTLNDLIERTRTMVYTETRDEKNRLTNTIDAVVEMLDIDFDARGIQAGAAIVIGTEQMHVWSINGTAVTVARGQAGTTAAAHTAGAIIFVNPKVSTPQIINALNDDLVDLSSSGLYQIKTVDLTFDSGVDAYDLTGVTQLIRILEVTFDAIDGTERQLTLEQSGWRLRRNQPTATFPSGLTLTINDWVRPRSTMRVAYAAPFVALTNLSDDTLAVAGLPATMADLPPYGAALNLTVGTEVARNFLTQMDTRRADEVPPGARGGAMRTIAARRQSRINDELARLYATYPTVRA